ncbi:Peroxidase superfamily protein [Euphorbia peplus]|nr:Peroxidase superfamily protein [Euphorbia peplus]
MTICSILKCEAHLHPLYYDKTCPKALSTIRAIVRKAVLAERRMAAKLIRLHFHDCFVQGCDGSILLDDTPTMQGEKLARNNNNSIHGFEVIDRAKAELENICPGVVSCADIVAVAARDATVAAGGGISWTVKLGRRDSTSASLSLADANLPAFTDPLSSLISRFEGKGLTERDMVALSGAHTLGKARCLTFRNRIYNASDIDAGFAATRRRQCPAESGNGDENLAPLDLLTPNLFGNHYFKNLIQRKGLLQSDQVLFSGGSTDSVVNEYTRSPSTFTSDFASAMVKMGDIDVLIIPRGEVRRRCNVVN